MQSLVTASGPGGTQAAGSGFTCWAEIDWAFQGPSHCTTAP
eukprot:CAMPEP_0175752168 /NCGR_PEP_ID=MMETSP0097-20121207/61620_1 /TAXON_ID=311494 /ORGANISM="Alexandrium monilatum, Strain CCMP3105" /LENGTH=40 /DNA_ID= /DNA_START= /DNA_END= /DNA_ORIENTATION=